jgi:hypothetical protein
VLDAAADLPYPFPLRSPIDALPIIPRQTLNLKDFIFSKTKILNAPKTAIAGQW